MFDREIKYINKNGIDSTAKMLKDTLPEIEAHLKVYVSRSETLESGFIEYTNNAPEDNFNAVPFILKYYPEVISDPDFDKYAWIVYLFYIHSLSLGQPKNWNDLSELIKSSLEKKGESYIFIDEDETSFMWYRLGNDPLARTPGENPFYEGFKYEALMRSRYKDVSPKDEQIIRKFHIIPNHRLGQDWGTGLISDFIFKRDSLYEALLYDMADWEYNKTLTSHFAELIQSIFRMQYPLIDSTINLADINTYSNNTYFAWHTMCNLVSQIFSQPTAFILYNWYLMNKNDEERLNLFIRVTWVIQNYTCNHGVKERVAQFTKIHTADYVSFGPDSINEILEVYEYTIIQTKKAPEIISEFMKITEHAFEAGKRQIEGLLEVLQGKMHQYSDKDLATIFVNGKDSIFTLTPESDILQFPFLPTLGFKRQIGSDAERRCIPGSVKYSFLVDYEGYDNAVDLHNFFCEDAYDKEISDWTIDVYKDLLKGGGADKFASNLSYQEWTAGETIPQTNVYNIYDIYWDNEEDDLLHMCDFFPPNTNFHPYQEILKKTSIYQIAHNTLYKIFCIKGELGLALENCCWIDDFLTGQDDDEYNILLDLLIASMRSYVYGLPKAKKIRKNTETTLKLYEKIRTLQRIRESVNIFRSIPLDINDKNGLSNALNRWTKLYNNSFPINAYDHEDDVIDILYNGILTALSEALHKMPDRARQLLAICEDNKVLFNKLDKNFDKLYQGIADKDNLKKNMKRQTQELLADASSLYAMFVSDSTGKGLNVPLNDYSPVALNYYRALEFLINQMFYIPYKRLVLDTATIHKPKDYFGNSESQIKLKGTLKSSLEIRTFSVFMGGINTKSKTLLPHTNYPKELNNFLVNRGVKINDFRLFCLDLYEVGNLRNACAHPAIQDESYAVKAKTVVYKHDSTDDAKISKIPDAIMIYELIIQLSNLVL